MKISAKKLYNQMLSWDFVDYRGWGNKKSNARKKWSKKLRNIIKKDTNNIIEEETKWKY